MISNNNTSRQVHNSVVMFINVPVGSPSEAARYIAELMSARFDIGEEESFLIDGSSFGGSSVAGVIYGRELVKQLSAITRVDSLLVTHAPRLNVYNDLELSVRKTNSVFCFREDHHTTVVSPKEHLDGPSILME